ncbi:unnamed protein product [Fraxinus pennsylvanica]|uniref:Pectinesterase inhibitor domain-containing protein n=1 Tax=Fraxinus pennsylvanica TaxID=56036 RepID=A0AAD2E619_9LAMI|nr:unnamed protein product [Fraxinus pennsylvanica]
MKASDLVSEICSKTRNSSECLYELRGEHGKNLSEMAQSLTFVAHVTALLANDTAQLCEKQEKNYLKRERCRSCVGNYVRIMDDLVEWKQSVNSGNYQNLLSKADAMSKEAESCDKNFEQPPSEPPQLVLTTKSFRDICSILVVVSYRLAGRII